MKGRKYGTGGVVASEFMANERETIGGGLKEKERARGREKFKRSTEMNDTKLR